MPSDKPQTNIRLSDPAKEALKQLAANHTEKLGVPVSVSRFVELLIREKAQKEGLKIKGL